MLLGLLSYMKSCKDKIFHMHSLQGNINIICITLCFPLGLFYVPKQFVSPFPGHFRYVISVQCIKVQSSLATRHHILPQKQRTELHGMLIKLQASADCHGVHPEEGYPHIKLQLNAMPEVIGKWCRNYTLQRLQKVLRKASFALLSLTT